MPTVGGRWARGAGQQHHAPGRCLPAGWRRACVLIWVQLCVWTCVCACASTRWPMPPPPFPVPPQCVCLRVRIRERVSACPRCAVLHWHCTHLCYVALRTCIHMHGAMHNNILAEAAEAEARGQLSLLGVKMLSPCGLRRVCLAPRLVSAVSLFAARCPDVRPEYPCVHSCAYVCIDTVERHVQRDACKYVHRHESMHHG